MNRPGHPDAAGVRLAGAEGSTNPEGEASPFPAAGTSEGSHWKSRPIEFRFSLSYLKLFGLTFQALEDTRPFDPDAPKLAAAQPPMERIPRGYDVIVERGRPLANPIPVIQRLPNMIVYAPRQMLHFYTDLRGGPGQAFKWMSSKTRSTLMRKVRGYREFSGDEIDWRIYRSREEVAVFHSLARDLARKTYQERLFDAGLPDSEEFRRQMLELAGRDLVRAYLLFHGGKPVAYLYTPAPDGFLVYEYLGYDPAYHDRSPGTVLQCLALEAAFTEQRFPMYYWSYGETQTKRLFSTGNVLGADIFYFRPTLRNSLAVRAHYGTDRFAASTGELLNRLKLKQRIKLMLKGQ